MQRFYYLYMLYLLMRGGELVDNIERIDKVINYIETNILENIDFAKIATIACCPISQFQRIFSFITDLTLSDYIRRRKLSLAAVELQHSNISVLDISLKYGYESHASFTRAFREHHKIAPSSARDENAILNIFPPISLQTTIIIKKGDIMLNYELISDWNTPVYKNGDRAIKIFPSNTPYSKAMEKARTQSLASEAGLPVPFIYGLQILNDGKIALEMDYIKSIPFPAHFMCENVTDDERKKAFEIVADLLRTVNSINANDFNLPKFSQVLTDEINETPFLTNQIKEKVFDLLSRLETGKKNLCHGDLHPGNIVFDGEKYWIVDWDGVIGDPAADACMTYFYAERWNPQYADAFLRSYCLNSNIKQDKVLDWLPVIAAYQVNIQTEDERNFILEVINKWYKNT